MLSILPYLLFSLYMFCPRNRNKSYGNMFHSLKERIFWSQISVIVGSEPNLVSVKMLENSLLLFQSIVLLNLSSDSTAHPILNFLLIPLTYFVSLHDVFHLFRSQNINCQWKFGRSVFHLILNLLDSFVRLTLLVGWRGQNRRKDHHL